MTYEAFFFCHDGLFSAPGAGYKWSDGFVCGGNQEAYVLRRLSGFGPGRVVVRDGFAGGLNQGIVWLRPRARVKRGGFVCTVNQEAYLLRGLSGFGPERELHVIHGVTIMSAA